MFEKIKQMVRYLKEPVDFKGPDSKPLTISMILGKDDSSRLLMHFSENELPRCESLVIIWRDLGGGINIESSDNLDPVSTAGILAIGQSMIAGGGADVSDN